MLRQRYASRHYEGTHIDMTPMVDCIMVLLIFLMVSSAFVEDPGIEVQKPDVGGTEVAEQNTLLVAISSDDRVYFDGQEIPIDQVALRVRQAAIGRSPALIIRADKGCSHGVFAAVYSEAKHAGIAHVQFATAQTEAP
ncbi:biopolymer transporter ExbD [Opitutaceae bacterium EW11]|nr:biopolymer transporter ExbD [Opitutaceae bacterium EW11]